MRWSVLAALANIMFSVLLGGTAAAVFVWLTGNTPQVGLLVFLGVAIVATPVAYQGLMAKRVGWVSPGEALVGGDYDGFGKSWNNPFGRNRLAVLLVQFATLGWLSLPWVGVVQGSSYSIVAIVGIVAILVLVCRALQYWAQGDGLGAYIVAGYYAVFSVGSYTLSTNAPPLEVQEKMPILWQAVSHPTRLIPGLWIVMAVMCAVTLVVSRACRSHREATK